MMTYEIDNDSQAVEEMHFARVSDTNPKAQQMANDVPMGMIEVLPLWDQILVFLKGATAATNGYFTAT